MHCLKTCGIMILNIYHKNLVVTFLELLKHKGVYPYEYMSTFKKIFEDKFPNMCALFSFYKISALVNKTIHILLMFGIRLKRTQWVIIMIFI